MKYLNVVSDETIIHVLCGMEDIECTQHILYLPYAEAVVMAEEFNRGFCDDRWALFSVNDIELDMLVDNESSVCGFVLDECKEKTPKRFRTAFQQQTIDAAAFDFDDIPF
jgi:hypothetical protein